MEVLYRHQPVFGSQPAAMVFPTTTTTTNLSQLPVPPAYMFTSSSPTCYPYQTTPSPYTPSRTPTPEYPRSGSHESNMGGQSTMLHSVLLGQVPSAYSHFWSPLSNEQHHNRSRSPLEAPSSSSPGVFGAGSLSSSPGSFRTLSSSSPVVLGAESCSPGMFGAVSSSSPLIFRGAGPGPVLSPPPEDLQTEPMDLSCKRPSSTSSISSSSSAFHHTLPPSPCEDNQGQPGSFSLLRNLLQVGKAPQPFSSSSPSQPSTSSRSVHSASPASDRSCDSPCSDSCSRTVSRMVCVTLAKSVQYNVSIHVSDWLMRMVQFAKSIPFFSKDLTRHDQEILLLSSWSRLLVLYMAEGNLPFEVTPVEEEEDLKQGASFNQPSLNQPTMKSVEELRSFIQKCKELKLEKDEYDFLRLLVLFSHTARAGNNALHDAGKVDSFNQEVLARLHNHVENQSPKREGRHCQLLMTLPNLYGFSSHMMDQLFCRRIDHESDTDAESLLIQMLDNIPTPQYPVNLGRLDDMSM